MARRVSITFETDAQTVCRPTSDARAMRYRRAFLGTGRIHDKKNPNGMIERSDRRTGGRGNGNGWARDVSPRCGVRADGLRDDRLEYSPPTRTPSRTARCVVDTRRLRLPGYTRFGPVTVGY